ncbi:hypothetical protein BN946_scf184996.g34 [Trametes cinnabarina]|uniref:Transaldolase n=1 Tax=Pycnoporus cinnabarinus TaxID=5643 RepID=A0A060S892_PYCCI|nr:hypothetical protein BN946_scf184996.g34 [Trametes cinnabarina]
MSERASSDSSSNEDFVPQTPDMPVATLRGKRRSNAHEQNGSSPSRIPVASPPPPPPASTTHATKTVTTTARVTSVSKVHNLQGAKGLRSVTMSSIPFPTSSAPAPPVLTATHAGFADIAFRFLNMPRIPKADVTNSSLGLGKRSRPSATRAKTKVDGQKSNNVQATLPLWRTLEAKGKGVIAATLDYELLGTLPYAGTMVTPGMLREGLLRPDTAYHAWVGAKRAIEERRDGVWDLASILKAALQHYLVELGASMLDRVEGPHYTFVDPRLHDNPGAMAKYAMKLVKLFAEKGYGRDRIVVTIPATEAGVQAARTIERKYHVQTNLTLVSGMHHAAVCAEAEATYITFCYQELSDAYGRKLSTGNSFFKAWEAMLTPPKRLAGEAIDATTTFFNLHEIPSRVLVANLQNASDAEELGEIDAVAFTAEQSLRARAPALEVTPRQVSTTATGTSAKQRAQEASYPTVYLKARNGAFLSSIPPDVRSVAKETLDTGLKDMTKQMSKAAAHVLEFIQGEAQLAHIVDDLALQQLYEEDEKEVDRLAYLEAAGHEAEPLCQVRMYDVGFRLRYSTWDTLPPPSRQDLKK